MGLYFGTSVFITAQPMRYATAQIQKIIKYPALIPSKPKNFMGSFTYCAPFASNSFVMTVTVPPDIVEPDEKSNRTPEPLLIRKAPIPPAIPPIPVMEAIAVFGNMSPIVEKRLADHAWCAAPAIPMMIIGNQYE